MDPTPPRRPTARGRAGARAMSLCATRARPEPDGFDRCRCRSADAMLVLARLVALLIYGTTTQSPSLSIADYLTAANTSLTGSREDIVYRAGR